MRARPYLSLSDADVLDNQRNSAITAARSCRATKANCGSFRHMPCADRQDRQDRGITSRRRSL